MTCTYWLLILSSEIKSWTGHAHSSDVPLASVNVELAFVTWLHLLYNLSAKSISYIYYYDVNYNFRPNNCFKTVKQNKIAACSRVDVCNVPLYYSCFVQLATWLMLINSLVVIRYVFFLFEICPVWKLKKWLRSV